MSLRTLIFSWLDKLPPRFLAGHRLRLQVSLGAHPRYARNLGTAEPVGLATTMVANDIEIIHGGTAITFPTYEL